MGRIIVTPTARAAQVPNGSRRAEVRGPALGAKMAAGKADWVTVELSVGARDMRGAHWVAARAEMSSSWETVRAVRIPQNERPSCSPCGFDVDRNERVDRLTSLGGADRVVVERSCELRDE